MVHPSRQFNRAGADRGEIERQRQRELIESAGGWYAYFKGQRRQREQAEAEARAEGQGKRPRGKGAKHG